MPGAGHRLGPDLAAEAGPDEGHYNNCRVLVRVDSAAGLGPTRTRVTVNALAKASALPRQEADKSIQRRVQEMMQPLIAEVRELKDQLQGNRSAPREADAGGAAAKSAKKSRNQNTQCESAETGRNAASEARAGKRKRRKRSAEAMTRDDSAPAPPSEIESEDQERKSGIRGNGKQGKRRSNGPTKKDQD